MDPPPPSAPLRARLGLPLGPLLAAALLLAPPPTGLEPTYLLLPWALGVEPGVVPGWAAGGG